MKNKGSAKVLIAKCLCGLESYHISKIAYDKLLCKKSLKSVIFAVPTNITDGSLPYHCEDRLSTTLLSFSPTGMGIG
ncbi:hypothetical protein N8482_00020 [Chitinophagales bacterium]|nr:hypothetical protein [Chitinophagales bacterium]